MSTRYLAVAALLLACSAAGPLRAQELTCDDIEFDEQARSNYSLVDQEMNVYLREGRWEVAMVDYDEPEIVEEYVAPIPVVSAPVEEEAQETAEPAAEVAEEEAPTEPAAEVAEEEAPAESAPESDSRTLLWILGIMALLIIVMIVRRRRARA